MLAAHRRAAAAASRIVFCLLTCVGALILPSCRTERPAASRFKATPPDGMFIFEAEAFRLVDAEIIEDANASDGLAVTMLTPRAFCSLELDLPPGDYVAVARVRAAGGKQVEFFLSTLSSSATMKAGDDGRFAYPPMVLEFKITPTVKDYLQFAAFAARVPRGEAGVTVDYIVVCEKQRWEAAPLDLD